MEEHARAMESHRRQRSLEYVDRLVDTYVSETSDPMAGWSKVEPKNSVNDPDRLKAVLRAYALRLLEQGRDPQQLLNNGSLSELARITNTFQSEFSLLEVADPRRNCVMYSFEQLGILDTLNPTADVAAIKSALRAHFRLIPDALPDNLRPDDLLVLHSQDEEQLHVGIIEISAGKVTCRSKLGSLWVVRNSDLSDLFRYYHTNQVEIYRKK
jgi:hypothetical protein